MTRSAEAGAPRRFIGAGIPAKTNRLLVAGKATYVADIDIPGTLHMAVVRSPYAHARIRRVDTRAADALPGVVTTISGAEIRANTGAIPTHSPALGEKPCPIYALAIDKVRYAGEPVAAVVAVDRYTAHEAARLLQRPRSRRHGQRRDRRPAWLVSHASAPARGSARSCPAGASCSRR